MNVSQIEIALIEYIKQYVIAMIPDNFVRFGALLVVKGTLPAMIQQYIPVMRKAGVIENDTVNIDKLQALMESTFKDVPEFMVADFKFTAADLPQFINFLKNGAQGNNTAAR